MFLEQVENWREDSEFLIHSADVEGLCRGIDEELVRSKWQMICMNSSLLMQSRTRPMGDNTHNLCRRCKRSVPSAFLLYKYLITSTADITDLDLVDRLSGGRVDLTYGRYICISRNFKSECLLNLKRVRYLWGNACEVWGAGEEDANS